MNALNLLGTERGSTHLQQVESKLAQMRQQALGSEYASRWTEGLPYWSDTPGQINVRIILWLRTLVLSYGMTEYAR